MKKERIGVELPQRIVDEAKIIAKKNGISLTALIRQALNDFLFKKEK